MDPKALARYKNELHAILAKAAHNPALLDGFLQDLLTPQEYEEIAVRWQIVRLLAEGIPQRTIAKNLKIGIATVTRGSRELSNPKGGFRKLLKKK